MRCCIWELAHSVFLSIYPTSWMDKTLVPISGSATWLLKPFCESEDGVHSVLVESAAVLAQCLVAWMAEPEMSMVTVAAVGKEETTPTCVRTHTPCSDLYSPWTYTTCLSAPGCASGSFLTARVGVRESGWAQTLSKDPFIKTIHFTLFL